MSVHRGKQSEEVKNVFCYRRYAYANWDRQSENDEILTIYDATARFYPFRLFSYCIHFISLDSAQLIRSSIVRNDGFARDFGADRPVMILKYSTPTWATYVRHVSSVPTGTTFRHRSADVGSSLPVWRFSSVSNPPPKATASGNCCTKISVVQ